MKTHNLRSAAGHGNAAGEGRENTNRATARGIRIIDRSGRDIEPVTTLRVPWAQELDDDEAELGSEVGQPYTNNAGVTLAVGTVVVIDGTTVILTTMPQDTRPVGVVIVAGVHGSEVVVQTAGKVDLVTVTAAVSAGTYAETSTTAGAATESATRRAGSFGVFLTAGTAPSALLFGIPDAATSTASAGEMVPYYIPTGETFTVPVYKQALFSEPISGPGLLVVEGMLIEVN